MDPIPEQVQFFLSKMPTRQERRMWIAHFRHRAETLERDFPEYEGLLTALNEALRAQRFDSK